MLYSEDVMDVGLYKEFAISKQDGSSLICIEEYFLCCLTCYMMEIHHGVVYRCYVIEINQTGFGLLLFD